MGAKSIDGFINLLKPPGISSASAVALVKKALQSPKAGHAGTLDPEAAGVLPIMIGRASRLFDVLVEKEKEYLVEIAFGASTDTQDAQGKVIARSSFLPPISELQAIIPQFIGTITQIPPAYSAVKIHGKPAYALSRKGQEPECAARPAYIDSISIIEQFSHDSVLMRVCCGKGVYMRTLCHDIGNTLHCPAHMRFLLRTKSGYFSIHQANTLEEIQSIHDKMSLLTPIDAPIAHLPTAIVNPASVARIRSGNEMTSFEHIDAQAYEGGVTRVYCGNVFAGLARWKDGALRFHAMLLGES